MGVYRKTLNLKSIKMMSHVLMPIVDSIYEEKNEKTIPSLASCVLSLLPHIKEKRFQVENLTSDPQILI